MSRTIRRRKEKVPYDYYDNTYTTIPYRSWYIGVDGNTVWYNSIKFIDLPKQCWNLTDKQKHKFHGESSFSKKKIKKIWKKRRRQWDRQELVKMYKEDYEPTWFTSKIDTWWWD